MERIVVCLFCSIVLLNVASVSKCATVPVPVASNISCTECAEGYGVVKKCTHLEDTVCKVCESGTFSDVVNSVDGCQKCAVCPQNQFELFPCSSWSDVLCEKCSDVKSSDVNDYAKKCIVKKEQLNSTKIIDVLTTNSQKTTAKATNKQETRLPKPFIPLPTTALPNFNTSTSENISKVYVSISVTQTTEKFQVKQTTTAKLLSTNYDLFTSERNRDTRKLAADFTEKISIKPSTSRNMSNDIQQQPLAITIGNSKLLNMTRIVDGTYKIMTDQYDTTTKNGSLLSNEDNSVLALSQDSLTFAVVICIITVGAVLFAIGIALKRSSKNPMKEKKNKIYKSPKHLSPKNSGSKNVIVMTPVTHSKSDVSKASPTKIVTSESSQPLLQGAKVHQDQ